MLWSRPTVLDDRGQRVGLFTPSRGGAQDDPELHIIMARVYESASVIHERVRLAHLLYILLGLGLMAVVVFASRFFPGFPPSMIGVAMMFAWLALAAVIGLRSRHRYSNRMAESIMRIGRCPTCGYRLAGTPASAEDIVVCPECGSAWKRGRIGGAAVNASDIPAPADTPRDVPPISWSLRHMWKRLPTIVDHRDRTMSLADPRFPKLEATVGVVRAADVRRELSERLGLLRQGWGCAIVVVLLVMIGPTGFVMVRSGFTTARFITLYMMVFWLFMGTRALYRLASGRSRLLAKQTVAILVGNRVCPACASDLGSQPVEPDGCTVCLMCGAAWKAQAPLLQNSTRNTTSV